MLKQLIQRFVSFLCPAPKARLLNPAEMQDPVRIAYHRALRREHRAKCPGRLENGLYCPFCLDDNV
jgi:hypothetical protein